MEVGDLIRGKLKPNLVGVIAPPDPEGPSTDTLAWRVKIRGFYPALNNFVWEYRNNLEVVNGTR